MWIVENKTPFETAGTFVRNVDGAEVWIVVVKATYSILSDGTTRISNSQEAVCRAPEYFGEPGTTSLKYDLDLIPDKPATDVVLHGHAYAPAGEKVKNLDVGIRVGPVNKKLKVTGDRMWLKAIGVSRTAPKSFSKMPIVYERTYGGIDIKHKKETKHEYEKRNPIGTGFSVKSSHLDKEKVPNITYPDNKEKPAGFGPVSANWEPRVTYCGTYDDEWEQTRMPLLPKDFDNRFYQQTPTDQQIEGYLKGGETVTLKNLNGHGIFKFNLPENRPEFITLFGDSFEKYESNLHTVIIEPNENRVMMVWHSALECHNKEHLLEKTIVRTKA